MECFTASVSTC